MLLPPGLTSTLLWNIRFMHVLISQTELGRRLGKSPATMSRHVRATGLKPFAVLVQRGKEDVLLFNVEQLPQLRQTHGNNPDRNISA